MVHCKCINVISVKLACLEALEWSAAAGWLIISGGKETLQGSQVRHHSLSSHSSHHSLGFKDLYELNVTLHTCYNEGNKQKRSKLVCNNPFPFLTDVLSIVFRSFERLLEEVQCWVFPAQQPVIPEAFSDSSEPELDLSKHGVVRSCQQLNFFNCVILF